MPEPVTLLDVRNVTKDYRGLRPLRIARLTLSPGEVLAVPGFDAITAEILVNLLTGASLPDAGDVRVLGRSTADVTNAAEWLILADRFGIVSERVVLLEGLTVAQNLAVPFTLLVDPVPDEIAGDARRLGEEAGLSAGDFDARISDTTPAVRWRVRLARALALKPAVLLLEHPGAALATADLHSLGARLAALALDRPLAVLALTADRASAEALGGRLARWNPATGAMTIESRWFRWRAR